MAIHDIVLEHPHASGTNMVRLETGWSCYMYDTYSGPCDLRLPTQPAKYSLKLKVVLK